MSAETAAIAERLRAFDSATIYEANDRTGAMEPGLRTRLQGSRLVGRARTVGGHGDDRLAERPGEEVHVDQQDAQQRKAAGHIHRRYPFRLPHGCEPRRSGRKRRVHGAHEPHPTRTWTAHKCVSGPATPRPEP